MPHEHHAAYYPASGTGYEVCECGATRRVEGGRPVAVWSPWPRPPVLEAIASAVTIGASERRDDLDGDAETALESVYGPND